MKTRGLIQIEPYRTRQDGLDKKFDSIGTFNDFRSNLTRLRLKKIYAEKRYFQNSSKFPE